MPLDPHNRLSDPYSWEDPRKTLTRFGLKPKRSYSQNFLVARPIVERMVEIVRREAASHVVEFGPGVGTLTRLLAGVAPAFTAVEQDPSMIEILNHDLGACSTLRLIHGDAAKFLFSTVLGANEKATLIANLPYASTGAILENLSMQAERLNLGVIMVQREVRDRLLAQPGNKTFGALSVFFQAAFDGKTAFHVGPNNFFPPPKVQSSVIVFRPKAERAFFETSTVKALVRSIFEQRRKTLNNTLRLMPEHDVQRAARALKAAQIDGQRRGETLTLAEIKALSDAWDT